MSFNIYNVPNHRLNGEKLRKINIFSTNDYCGVLGQIDAPVFSKSNNRAVVNSSVVVDNVVTFIAGGCLITAAPEDIAVTTLQSEKYYYIDVVLDFSGDNILSDVGMSISLKSTSVTTAILNEIRHYMGLPDDEANPPCPQTIWTNTGFRIPLFYTDLGNNIISIIFAQDKSNVENYLTSSAINTLKTWMHKTFTHQNEDGSASTTPNYGKVGSLVVSGDEICSVDGSSIIKLTTDGVRIFPYEDFTTGIVYATSGNLSTKSVLPVADGGTGATARGAARNNLGIYYGTADPNVTSPTNNPVKGDIYYKILT